MSSNTYKIKKALLLPFAVDVILLLLLLLISLIGNGSSTERIVLTVIFIPSLYLLLEALYRRVSLRDEGITIQKFLRKKDLLWQDITQVGGLIVRKKVYILLTTTKGFYIISNAYEKFSNLAKDFVEHVGPEKVEEEIRSQIEHPIKDISNIILTWLAALVILGIIIMKLRPF